MTLLSPEFQTEGILPEKYSKDGQNIHPPFTIYEIPSTAASLALVFRTASGSLRTHWVMWNIPKITTRIDEGVVPANAEEGYNDFQEVGYRGPSAENGQMRYQFTLYALSTTIHLEKGSDWDDLNVAMRNKILARAQMYCVYG